MLLALTLLLIGQQVGEDVDLRPRAGPGRFCGYSAIIDLLPGETIRTTGGGIHSGIFTWTGDFGSLDVANIGWASKPQGKVVRLTRSGQTLFKIPPRAGRPVYAIWNRAYGSAYFSSDRPFSAEQLAAIDRVYLFDETQPDPQKCKYRTIFSME